MGRSHSHVCAKCVCDKKENGVNCNLRRRSVKNIQHHHIRIIRRVPYVRSAGHKRRTRMCQQNVRRQSRCAGDMINDDCVRGMLKARGTERISPRFRCHNAADDDETYFKF